MINGIRTGGPRGYNKGRNSKFRVGSRVWQTLEEGQKTYWPKHCGNNNKDKDDSPKTLNDKKLFNFIWEIDLVSHPALFKISKNDFLIGADILQVRPYKMYRWCSISIGRRKNIFHSINRYAISTLYIDLVSHPALFKISKNDFLIGADILQVRPYKMYRWCSISIGRRKNIFHSINRYAISTLYIYTHKHASIPHYVSIYIYI